MKLTRRQVLKTGALSGGALVVGMHLGGCSRDPFPHRSDSDLQPNAFLQVSPSGQFTLQLHKAEMGQGVYTGMSTLVAEELDMDPALLRVQHAPVHADFRDPEMMGMITGGSSSMRNSYLPLRQAAATLKALLITAAAQHWQTEATALRLRDGEVLDTRNDRQIGVGSLVAAARELPVPGNPVLKQASEFRYIGKPAIRSDAADKVTGKAQFGIDAPMENALVAVLRRCPHLGGQLKTLNADKARAVSGVRHIVEVNGGVAVVADGYWAARKAAAMIDIEWDKGPLAGLSSDSHRAQLRQLAASGKARKTREDGRADAATGHLMEAEYHVPQLSHCPMEPPNALASVTPQRVDIWTGTQAPDAVQAVVASALGRPRSQVHMHNQMLGGGFGRRLFPDYVVEAALIAQKVDAPVRLIWSREDDIQHDYYRPSALVKLRATVDGDQVTSLQGRVVCPSLYDKIIPIFSIAMLPEWVPPAVPRAFSGLARHFDSSVSEGLANTDYQFPYLKMEAVRDETPIPGGFWRSVGHSQNAFFMESFIDEMAHAVGADPVAFRLRHLPEASPRRRVLELAAQKAGWGHPPEGQFQGVAVHESFKSTVAQVVHASVEKGQIRVHKVVCVIDCGRAINPDVVIAQMESGIIFGLSAALHEGVRFEDGRVQQSNFHDYPVLRMQESPDIEVHILESDAPPTGVGEPGTPPLAPALANALFAATGQRLRQLPLKLA